MGREKWGRSPISPFSYRAEYPVSGKWGNRATTPFFHRVKSILEVDASVDGNGPCAAGAGDAAETGGIDVGVRVVPYRPVQHIDGVGTDGERRFLRKPG